MSQLTVVDLVHYKFLSEVSFAPDGQKAAFVVKEADIEENDYQSTIWLYNFQHEKLVQLTNSGEDEKLVWTPDGKHLLFVSQRGQQNDKQEEEETDIYKISIQGGEAKKVLTLPHRLESMQLAQNKLIYKALVDIEPKSKNNNQEEGDCQALDEIPFWSNGSGFTNKKRAHLFGVDLETGKSRQLTPGYIDVGEYDFRFDSVILVGVEYKNKLSIYNDVYIFKLATDKITKLTKGDRNFHLVRFLDRKTAIVSSTDMVKGGINQNKELQALHLPKGELTPLRPGWDKSPRNGVLTDVRLGESKRSLVEGDKFYFITTEESSSYLNSIDIDGNLNRVTHSSGSIDSFDVKNGQVVYVGLRGQNLQELYSLANDKEVRLTSLNKKVLSDKVILKPEHFTVKRGKAQVDAWILKPIDYRPGNKYPAILQIHGGPKSIFGEVFFHELQVLAHRGYAVVYSNPRGSDGKGDKFSDIREKYGQVDYEDLMAVMDRAIEKYDFINPDKLGATGGSYGGFMTNWIIGHTDRFKAAVSQRGIANWISKFNTTDIGYYFVKDQQGTTPWENHQKLWDQSPLKFANRVKTPTLFIHADRDYRCWLAEGLQMFTALKYFGVAAKLCLFKGENHELSRSGKPQNRIRRLQEILNWFDKYLKNEE